MTKTFCDICNKELIPLECVNAYKITITSANKMCCAPWTQNYPEVCEDCVERITSIISSLKEKNNNG